MSEKPLNILQVAEQLQGKDPYAGQFGQITPGLEVAQPPMSTQNPFAMVGKRTAPEVMATIRPMYMDSMGKPIKPEVPTAGQGNGFQTYMQEKKQ